MLISICATMGIWAEVLARLDLTKLEAITSGWSDVDMCCERAVELI